MRFPLQFGCPLCQLAFEALVLRSGTARAANYLLRYGVEKYSGTIEDTQTGEDEPVGRFARIGQWLRESF